MTSQAVAFDTADLTPEALGQPTGRELVDRFQTCRLEPDHFQHAQHIEVAWNYVREWPVLEAIGRFDHDLLRFACL